MIVVGHDMTSWTERMQRRAATLSNVVISCGHPSVSHIRRIEKVKFGIPIEEVCKNDIPAPLLILILKTNKEGPVKKDVFRAPGHQGNMKKLIYFLQNGRLINIDNFSVHTIASVLKKFLREIPDGIFGTYVEQELFSVIQTQDIQSQRNHIHELILSLPVITQHLLVLLFGTFRVIALSSKHEQNGMTSEALGVSVAPSFFQLCVSEGKYACMEDVFRFKSRPMVGGIANVHYTKRKESVITIQYFPGISPIIGNFSKNGVRRQIQVATKIMKFLIDNFGVSNIFGRANYEYYARITGRILKVDEEWIFSFRYPPNTLSLTLPLTIHDESQSTPALIHVHELEEAKNEVQSTHSAEESAASPYSDSQFKSLLKESCTRLSISLEENSLYKVHERQIERMKTRSRWFLSPWQETTCLTPIDYVLEGPEQELYILHSDSVVEEGIISPET